MNITDTENLEEAGRTIEVSFNGSSFKIGLYLVGIGGKLDPSSAPSMSYLNLIVSGLRNPHLPPPSNSGPLYYGEEYFNPNLIPARRLMEQMVADAIHKMKHAWDLTGYDGQIKKTLPALVRNKEKDLLRPIGQDVAEFAISGDCFVLPYEVRKAAFEEFIDCFKAEILSRAGELENLLEVAASKPVPDPAKDKLYAWLIQKKISDQIPTSELFYRIREILPASYINQDKTHLRERLLAFLQEHFSQERSKEKEMLLKRSPVNQEYGYDQEEYIKDVWLNRMKNDVDSLAWKLHQCFGHEFDKIKAFETGHADRIFNREIAEAAYTLVIKERDRMSSFGMGGIN